MVTWLLFDWQWPFWLAISYMTLHLRREPGPLQGTEDGQVTGTAGQGTWMVRWREQQDSGSELQGLLVSQPRVSTTRFMRATAQPPVDLANEDAQTGPLWLVSLYCLIAFHDTGIPGVMILAGNNWSLSLSVVSVFPTWTDSEKEILCPLPVCGCYSHQHWGTEYFYLLKQIDSVSISMKIRKLS